MDEQTHTIFHGDPEDLEKLEQELGRKLVPVPDEEAPGLLNSSKEERKAWLVEANRARAALERYRKQRRKTQRKARKANR